MKIVMFVEVIAKVLDGIGWEPGKMKREGFVLYSELGLG
jgi:hypothetical protein